MARKLSSRVVLNRKALNAIGEGFVAGMEAMGREFKEIVRPPDATPFGQGLVTTPDYAVFAGTKKVAGGASRPRGVKLSKTAITLVAGEGFPGRFQELGTITNPAQPHVTPAMERVLPGASAYLSEKVRAKLAGVR